MPCLVGSSTPGWFERLLKLISRRRKTKCNGIRPKCRYCTMRNLDCTWPISEATAPSPLPTSASHMVRRDPEPQLIEHLSHSTLQDDSGLPSSELAKWCLEDFFSRHFVSDFCSFSYRPGFQQDVMKSPFLATAIVSLCVRYIPIEKVDNHWHGNKMTPNEISKYFLGICQSLARDTSDQPTVINIQGNLILAFSEFLLDSGSSHWMHAGAAIRMAQIMRLNKEYHHKHSEQEREIRRRTFWACLQIDRMFAFYLAKPHTLALRNIALALPGNDTSLAYGESSRSLTLDGIVSHLESPSSVGLQPYLIKSICLWGDLADFHVCQERMLSPLPPTHPDSRFFQLCAGLKTWISGLPDTVKWSPENYQLHLGLHNEELYLGMHCLLQSAFCVAHQDYLPQTDENSILLDSLDASGWSLLHLETGIVSDCLRSALEIGEMISTYVDSNQNSNKNKPSLLIALAISCSSNCLLWLQYTSEYQSHSSEKMNAALYFQKYLDILKQWGEIWYIGSVWLRQLKEMHALYRIAYLGTTDDGLIHDTASESGACFNNHTSDGGLNDHYRPAPGDGMPLNDIPRPLGAFLRFNGLSKLDLCTEYRSSVWKALMQGWPQNVDTTSWEELFASQQLE